MAKEVKNGTSRLHVCNGQKLAKILAKKGLNAREFSAELGYNITYLPKVIRTNKIGETAVGLLLSKGIKPTQYDVNMETTVKSKDPVTVAEVFDSLPKEAKEEVYSEVEKAIEEAEKAPVERALEDPGVVKIELTLDMVKLKAIVKQAVKEAYEEL